MFDVRERRSAPHAPAAGPPPPPHERRRERDSYAALLKGRGLEIGALNAPMALPAADEVVYSDLLDAETIERLYPGAQKPDIVSDSESFPGVETGWFDFVVANHVLEHLTDPIAGLAEWHRILRPGGLALIAVPDKRYTFDRPRPRTKLRHLVEDNRNPLSARLKNLGHLIEWATHVEGLAPGSQAWADWIEIQFSGDYSVHNHVWVLQDLLRLLIHLYARSIAPFGLRRHSNTRLFGDEVVLLLEARKHPSGLRRTRDLVRYAFALAGAWATNPVQIVQAGMKTAWRGAARSRAGR